MDKNEYEIKRNAIKAVIQNIEKENEFCIGGNCNHCLYGYRDDKLSKEKCNELNKRFFTFHNKRSFLVFYLFITNKLSL